MFVLSGPSAGPAPSILDVGSGVRVAGRSMGTGCREVRLRAPPRRIRDRDGTSSGTSLCCRAMRWIGWLVSLLKIVAAGLLSLSLLAGWAAAVALPWVLVQGREDWPSWAPWAAAGAVFPVLPLLWHLVSERRVRAGALLRGRDRLVLRALVVAALSTGVVTAVAPAEVSAQWSRVRQVARAYLPAQVLGWLQRASGPRELVALAPSDASWVVVADLARMEQPPVEEDEMAFPDEEHCGVDLARAEVMFALGELPVSKDPPILFVVRAKGIGDRSVVACLWGAMMEHEEDPLELQFDGREDDGWQAITLRHRDPPETIEAGFYVFDANTVGFVSTSWRPGVTRARENGVSAREGRLAGALARIDRTTSFWGAVGGDIEGVHVDAGGSIEADENTFRWAASAAPGTEQDARQLESGLLELATHVKKWGAATSWVPGDHGERWTADLAVRREGSVVYGDFVVGRNMATRAGKLMFFSW